MFYLTVAACRGETRGLGGLKEEIILKFKSNLVTTPNFIYAFVWHFHFQSSNISGKKNPKKYKYKLAHSLANNSPQNTRLQATK